MSSSVRNELCLVLSSFDRSELGENMCTFFSGCSHTGIRGAFQEAKQFDHEAYLTILII